MTTETPTPSTDNTAPENATPEQKDAFVKLAMRNMVSKGAKSLFHFGLTAVGLLTVLVGLAYLTR